MGSDWLHGWDIGITTIIVKLTVNIIMCLICISIHDIIILLLSLL